ncbi:MAG: hypothetical protein HY901_20375, partial [Deltaproteobacteria bacterium]|nr:hypothetical protein [Deltaproteobacteria bacterium]
YAERRPEISRIVGQMHNTFGLFGLLAGIFPLVGATLLGFAIRSNRREIRAFTHGAPALARVVFSGLDRAVKVNGRHPFLVRWTFQAEGGAWTGSISAMDQGRLEGIFDAGEIVVLYLPGAPQVNTVWVA